MYPVHWRTDALKFVARNLDLRIEGMWLCLTT
jgi:hypothetical protein